MTPSYRKSLNLSLYLVANRPSFQNEKIFFEKVAAAVRGGVSCVQLRDYTNNLSTHIETSRRLREMLQRTPLFINTTHPFEVCRAVDAAGVYLEGNSSPSEARQQLGENPIIGLQAQSVDQITALQNSLEIDYISVKIAPSKKTCPRNDLIWGLEGFKKIQSLSFHPLIAIGGLKVSSIESIFRELRLNDGVAMAGGLMDEEHPDKAAQEILSLRRKIEASK